LPSLCNFLVSVNTRPNDDAEFYKLRSVNEFVVPLHALPLEKSEYGSVVRGPKLWNILDDYIQNSLSIGNFKKKFFSFMKNNIQLLFFCISLSAKPFMCC
jgi:hypothetical protein